MTAIDVSEDALALAAENAERTGSPDACSSRIHDLDGGSAARPVRPRRLEPAVRRARRPRRAPAGGARLGAARGARRPRRRRKRWPRARATCCGLAARSCSRWRTGTAAARRRPARGARLHRRRGDARSRGARPRRGGPMDAVGEASQRSRRGEPVVLPTDTVYGLCADAESEAACRRALALKGRPEGQPAALLAADVDALLERVPELPEADPFAGAAAGAVHARLREPRAADIPGWREETIGVRVPASAPTARPGVGAVGAVMATSANLHGGPDPRTLAEVPEEIRAALRRARRRRRAAWHPVDGARPHRRRAAGPPRGRSAAAEALAYREACQARVRVCAASPSTRRGHATEYDPADGRDGALSRRSCARPGSPRSIPTIADAARPRARAAARRRSS